MFYHFSLFSFYWEIVVEWHKLSDFSFLSDTSLLFITFKSSEWAIVNNNSKYYPIFSIFSYKNSKNWAVQLISPLVLPNLHSNFKFFCDFLGTKIHSYIYMPTYLIQLIIFPILWVFLQHLFYLCPNRDKFPTRAKLPK